MRTARGLGFLIGMVFLVTLDGFGAGKLDRPEVVGSIAGITGTVKVDQHTVLPREAVFAGDRVSTGSASGAFLNLRGTIAILVENSELALVRAGDSTTMTLMKGAVEIRSGNSQPALVNIPGASVIVRSEGTFPSICRIASVDKSAVVFADKGHVEIHGTGAPTIVPPGKSVRLEAGVPQAAGQHAGKVSGHIPTGTVQHEGKGTPIVLKLSDPIYWEDLVATQGNGRIRIALEGGSYLNIGARSQMRIIQHDAQSQQTAVELKLGTLRGEVVKLAKGGKFETRTPTAVIGVVGTVWAVTATPRVTHVWSVTGDVNVKNIDPKISGEVTLHTGQTTSVQLGKPPNTPTEAPASQMQTQVAQTNVEEGAGAAGGGTAAGTGGGTAGGTGGGGAGGAGGGVAGGGGFSSGSLKMISLAASGAGVVTGGVSIHETNKANDSLKSADSSLANAAASAANAQNAANQALAAAQQASNIATATANNINAILQGCGCVSPSVP